MSKFKANEKYLFFALLGCLVGTMIRTFMFHIGYVVGFLLCDLGSFFCTGFNITWWYVIHPILVLPIIFSILVPILLWVREKRLQKKRM